MLAQRGPPAMGADSRDTQGARSGGEPRLRGSPAEANVAAVVMADPAQAATRPRRLTFKDRHALETLPARIAALQAESRGSPRCWPIPICMRAIRPGSAATTQALGAAQDALAAAEEQWLTLEMLREEIEG